MLIHKIEFIFFQLFKWFLLLLPLKSVQKIGSFLGLLGFYFVRRRRAIALENLKFAFPQKSEKEIKKISREAFQNFGITFSELLWFPNLTDKIIQDLVEIKNIELMKEKFKAGKGVVMLSGHCSNWELLALAVGHISQIPLTIIVQTQNNRIVDAVINKHRCIFGNRVVPQGMAVREIIRTLDEGGVVAIAPDQSGPQESIYVDFFGRNVATHQGPAVFTLRSGAPLLMVFMNRKPDGRYFANIEEIPTFDLVGYSEKNVIELTKRHTSLLERHIRAFPGQWLWMHRRWKNVIPDHIKEKTASSLVHA